MINSVKSLGQIYKECSTAFLFINHLRETLCYSIFGAAASFACKKEVLGISQQGSHVKQEQAMVLISRAVNDKLI